MNSYLTILQESLEKKIELLQEIQEYNLEQQNIFQSEDVQMELFDEYINKKDALIQRINRMDEGFQSLYDNVEKELKENREKHIAQIQQMQLLVTRVVELGVEIEAQEARNKKLVETYFSRQRGMIGQGRKTSTAAYNYYKSMNKLGAVAPQMLDSKK